ncbi:SRPBCC family protein [Streptosporangium canum]|uniref:SRPBCC family protein n=1 Tax=Streptosporangium canum TaxID=324952 RepID=UPI0033B23D15
MSTGSTIEQTVWIRARPETVWRHFTDPVRLARWWGEAEVDPRPGGDLVVRMREGPRPIMRGQFVELEPYERIVFTFGWEATPGAPAIPAGASRVEITLAPESDGVTLTLRHSGLPFTLERETGEGWDHVLRRLAEKAPSETAE